MITLRLTGLAIVFLQCGWIAYMHGIWVECCVVAAIALAGATGKWRVQRTTRTLNITALMLALGCGLYWQLYLQLRPSVNLVLSENLSTALALYCTLLQALTLYLQDLVRRCGLFALLGGIAMALAADMSPTDMPAEKVIFFAGYALYIAVVLVFLNAGTRRRAVRYQFQRILLLTGTFAGSVILAWYTLGLIDVAEEQAFNLIAGPKGGASQLYLGTRDQVNLSSVTNLHETDGERVALRVYSDDAPGYLRGGVYDRYTQGGWRRTSDALDLRPITPETPGFDAPGAEYFQLAEASPGWIMECWPDPRIRNTLFIPQTAAGVAIHAEHLEQRSGNTLRTLDPLDGRPYAIYFSQDHRFTEQDAPGVTYLTLPDTIDPGIPALARRITADVDSPAEKAAAVTRHLVGRHDYATNISVPFGEDPLAWFLLSEPAADAHCEYFAAAATVLLRAADVPTRYVTGVLVHEQHPWADYWVARNRDAHAWCEAWDAEAGRWFLVEATPASARPDEAAPAPSLADSLRDQLGMWWAKLRARVENWRETLTVTTVAAAVLVCVAMLVSAFALRYVLRRKRNKRTSSSGPLLPGDRLRARIARLGGELDAMVRRAGWERGRGEAPAHYAARLLNSVPDLPAALPDAYYLYSRLRFGPLVSLGDCEALEKKIAEAAHGIQVLRRTRRNP